jgi:capsular exopolysaccharide synthesis family protein
VILVDADIRRPTLHKQFNLPNAIGFTGLVLNQGADVSSVVQVVPEVDNLMVITSGPQPLRPAELFTSDRLVQVMAQIAEQADIVIYDTPPVGVVTDAVMLASRVDAVVLVVGAGVSRKGMIMQMRQGLQTARVTTLLPVINGVKDKDLQGYSYHYYYYHDYHRYFEDVVLGESETPRTNGRSLPVTALSTGDPVSQADPGALNGGSSQPQQRTGRYRHPSSGPN